MGQRITFHNAAVVSADGTLASLNQGDIGGVTVQIVGANSFQGTVVFEVRSADSTTWLPIVGRSIADWTTLASTVTNPTNAGYVINVRGWHYFRARVTRTQGDVTVYGTLTNGVYTNA